MSRLLHGSRGLMLANAAMGGGSFSLPYSIDFSALADGALPARLTGATWTIASGKAINTPALSAEVLTNGNMETGDPPGSWTLLDATLDSITDERTGGAGTKSISVAKAASNTAIAFQVIDAGVDKNDWIELAGWIKNVDATYAGMDVFNSSIGIVNKNPAAWTFYRRAGAVTAALNCYVRLRTSSTGAVGTYALYDDISVKKYTPAQLNALLPASRSLVTAKVQVTGTEGIWGVDVCCDADKSNYVRGFIDLTNGTVSLVKCVSGTVTVLISNQSVTYAAKGLLEVRHTAAETFQLWYRNAQVGADQTVSDATIINNTLHGMFGTGGAAGIDAFFCE